MNGKSAYPVRDGRFCKNCRYCQIIVASWSEEDRQYLCDYHRDNVTGLPIPCRMARDNEKLCGERGLHYLTENPKSPENQTKGIEA